MKHFFAAVLVLSITIPASTLPTGCGEPVSLNATTNVFKTYKLHPNIIYRRKVEAAAAVIEDPQLKAKALKVADIGSFVSIDGNGQIPKIEEALQDVPCTNILGLVLSGLQYKQCGGIRIPPIEDPTVYRKVFIDPIAKIIKANPNTAFALIIEPGAIGDVIANAGLSSCHETQSYKTDIPYALQALNLPNTVMYIDAAHGGWLGWTDNLKPGARMLSLVWEAAGRPAQVRGIAINVNSYNSWYRFPDEHPLDAQYNRARTEQAYLHLIAAELDKAGMPHHAIMDSSRNGVFGIRREWGNWCNVKGAGFGHNSSADTKDEMLDAFVWAKGGGESDGTSDAASTAYNSFCGKDDAFKPMPGKGEWSQGYFEQLLKNWSPTGNPPV
ncbi:glycoside hydrolase family 6 protein [Amniculicola lignicola CBS 123094]|uniref:Glucanase n=1 Tax=Amniculicola lignicola CBS 123094 TaxID=1392246 RepID=A0A6A5WR47_9PLEO|nr:glycoside hydrolase family 6 protein [Amniculicola lignicola CBS 123094]